MISILREAEAGVSARELCRKHAISDATFYIYGLPPFCKY
ncbi:transposase, partial [Klebsiella oxytoca]